MEKKRLREAVFDLLKMFLLGMAASLLLGLALMAAGALLGSHGISSGLEAAKDGMLILAAAGMFLVAGMLLAKGKKGETVQVHDGFRAHFAVIGFKTAIGMCSITFLLAAQIFDILLLAGMPVSS